MRRKQGLLIVCDGLGDRPIGRLNGDTPLEHASTPNLDRLASQGMVGNVYPHKPGVRVGTDVGHLLILGYDTETYYYGRGPIEAASAGIDLQPGDIAFRGNFATLDGNGRIIDRRAGRITEGTSELASALNGLSLEGGVTVLARELTSHRLAVVFRGAGLSASVRDTDPGATSEGNPWQDPTPLDSTPEAARTANLVREFSIKASRILSNHRVNLARKEEGSLPANFILLRGPGKMGPLPKLSEGFPIRPACVAGDKTILGITRMAGFDTFTDPRFTGEADTWLEGKIGKALELLHSGYDWVLVHIKAPDLAGHDDKPEAKVEIIERWDKAMGLILNEIDLSQCYIGFTADHATPCEVGDHSGDPVPTCIAGVDVRKDGIDRVGERFFRSGSLQNLSARDIFMIQMDLMGRTEKYGS
ncbi:MAG: 2,3-bisphosphoglycerate-independent phosphoglycerate mutase [Spirochaetes bacterium]|nr:2,3-bisphosphoglycerate-independent phosphoglycerate mutase [Spirochaetota bacterium]